MQLGLLFTAAANCKKAYDVLKRVKDVPEETLHLYRLIDSLQQPLSLCMRLNSRIETCNIVLPAVQLTHQVLESCEQVLNMKDVETLEKATDSSNSWNDWWSKKPGAVRESVAKSNVVPALTSKISDCIRTLQLAMQTVQMLAPAPYHSGLHPCSSLHLETVRRAKEIFHLFEMGRLEKHGNQYQVCAGRLCSFQRGSTGRLSTRETSGSWMLESSATGCVLRPSKDPETSVFDLIFLKTEEDELGEGIMPQEKTPGRKSMNMARNDEELEISHCIPLTATTSVDRLPFSPEATIGDGGQTYFGYTIDQYRVDFLSCFHPSQFCYFPDELETYIFVTREVFEMILVFSIELAKLLAKNTTTKGGGRKSGKVSNILPTLADVMGQELLVGEADEERKFWETVHSKYFQCN